MPRRVTLIAGCLSTLAYLYLAFSSQHYGDTTLMALLGTTFTCAALSFLVWFAHYRTGNDVSIPLLILFAALFRVIGIFAFPILEDDGFRYLWDGYLTVTTGSPYTEPPLSYFGRDDLPLRFDEILGLINYPDVATVYGPTCQWVFAVAYLIAPGEIWPLQAMFALADMGVLLILLRFAKPNAVLLYAWCPLIVKEFAFTAHPDVLGVLFLMLAFWCLHQKEVVWVGVFAALALGVKVFALLMVPFLLAFNWRSWLAFIVTAMLIALPFGVIDAWLPQGLRTMGSEWVFNAPMYILLVEWFDLGWIKIGLLSLFAAFAGWYVFTTLKHRSTAIPRGDYLYAAFFLCTPVFNPWYLVWLLPFAVIRPSLWAWCASVSLVLSYISGINLENQTLQAYEIPYWVLLVEFGVIAIAVAAQPYLARFVSKTFN